MTSNASENLNKPARAPISWFQRAVLSLGGAEKLEVRSVPTMLYLWVASLTEGKDEIKYPGNTAMAEVMDTSPQSVCAARKRLEDAGLLSFRRIKRRASVKEMVRVLVGSIKPELENFVQNTLFGARTVPVMVASSTAPVLLSDPVPEPAESPAVNPEPAPEPESIPVEQPVQPPPAPVVEEPIRPTRTGKAIDEEITLICSSHENMTNYLCYGIDFFRGMGKIKSVASNWRVHGGTSVDPKCEQWTVNQFVGYFWFRVSLYREQNQMQITMPLWGHVARDMKNLRDSMTAWQLFQYIGCVIGHFDLIRHMLGNMGKSLLPNESILMHKAIRSAADAIAVIDRNGKIEEAYGLMRNGRPIPWSSFGS